MHWCMDTGKIMPNLNILFNIVLILITLAKQGNNNLNVVVYCIINATLVYFINRIITEIKRLHFTTRIILVFLTVPFNFILYEFLINKGFHSLQEEYYFIIYMYIGLYTLINIIFILSNMKRWKWQ